MNPIFTSQVSKVRPLLDYLDKQRDNRKFVKSVEVSATFFLITFFLYFAIRPTFSAISTLNGQIESKKILQAELKNKINNVIQAQDLFSQVQEKYSIVNSSLPDHPSYLNASNQIQQAGSNGSLVVDNLNFDFNNLKEAQIDPNVKYYKVSLGFNGPYVSSLAFVSDLLQNRRLINISSLRFGSEVLEKSASSSASSVNSSFSAIFYYWPNTNEKK